MPVREQLHFAPCKTNNWRPNGHQNFPGRFPSPASATAGCRQVCCTVTGWHVPMPVSCIPHACPYRMCMCVVVPVVSDKPHSHHMSACIVLLWPLSPPAAVLPSRSHSMLTLFVCLNTTNIVTLMPLLPSLLPSLPPSPCPQTPPPLQS